MKQKIKLNFADFWPGFDKKDNFFYRLLKEYYDIEISDSPNYLICSCFGKEHKKFNGIKIFYTGENIRPDLSQYDYAFSFDYMAHPNHYRLPVYALYFDPFKLEREMNIDFEKILYEKTGFCCFVVSNAKAKKRIKFFNKLSKYKKVDSGGKYLNNIGGPIKDKLQFIRRFKFIISFENSSHAGYTTEKIAESFLEYCLPIYWGNPLVDRDFNPKSFLNYHDFKNEDGLIEKIIELDKNDDLYLSYLKQPCYHRNKINNFVRHENIIDQFNYIFSNSEKLTEY